jgi:WS/DGAT/MGAT family acyltransferase
MTTAPIRLSGLDTASLLLETDACPLHMMAVLLLDTSTTPGGYSYANLRNFLETRIHVVPPLLRCVAGIPGALHRPVWVDAENIDWEYHLPRTVVTTRLDLVRLGQIAGEVASQRLDRGRPLWRLRVVEDATSDQVALIATVHHALMDGLGGMEFMASLFELKPTPHEPAPISAPGDDPRPSRLSLLSQAARDLALLPADAAKVMGEGAHLVFRYATRPATTDESPPLPFTAPRTIFNGRLTSRRSIALQQLPFAAVKSAAHTAGATINDIVLAVVSGALREYLRRRGSCPVTRLVAGVPAATDGPGGGFGNALTYLFVRLPTDIDDPRERLRIAARESDIAKRRGQSIGLQTLTSALDLLTPTPIDAALGIYRNVLVDRVPPLWNVFVSNVPGTPVPLYVAGARLTALFPLGPIYEGFGLNITVISHERDLDIGLVTCTDLVPDVDELTALFLDCFTELTDALGVGQSSR